MGKGQGNGKGDKAHKGSDNKKYFKKPAPATTKEPIAPPAPPPKKSFGSNWAQLKSKIAPPTNKKPKKLLVTQTTEVEEEEERNEKPTGAFGIALPACSDKRLEDRMRRLVVGLDCEMVGLGDNGRMNALARCSLVDFDGNVIYDTFVQPKGFVTDFRTKYSGIRKSSIRKDQAVTLEECQRKVTELLKGKILVGHALKNDLNVLFLSHPNLKIRDTARYKPYMRVRNKYGKLKPRALKDLTQEYLGKKIQEGEHDSAEDARCAVMLYRIKMKEWEDSLVEGRLKKKGSEDVTATTATTTGTTVSGKGEVKVSDNAGIMSDNVSESEGEEGSDNGDDDDDDDDDGSGDSDSEDGDVFVAAVGKAKKKRERESDNEDDDVLAGAGSDSDIEYDSDSGKRKKKVTANKKMSNNSNSSNNKKYSYSGSNKKKSGYSAGGKKGKGKPFRK